MIKIAFWGSPSFVIPVAQSIAESPFGLNAVITNPDQPIGRKHILTPTPIKQWAIDNHITCLSSNEFNKDFKLKIKNLKFDLGILAAYGKIIPPEIYQLFPLGILVIHPSLLPKYRGASPIQAAIVNQDKETGVTIFKINEKVDQGEIIYQFKSPLFSEENAQNAYERLFSQTADILPSIIDKYINNKLHIISQKSGKETLTKLLKKEDGFFPFNQLYQLMQQPNYSFSSSIRFMNNQKIIIKSQKFLAIMRAFSLWPGVWTLVQHRTNNKEHRTIRMKIFEAHTENNKLVLDKVQLEGKNPVSWQVLKQSENFVFGPV